MLIVAACLGCLVAGEAGSGGGSNRLVQGVALRLQRTQQLSCHCVLRRLQTPVKLQPAVVHEATRVCGPGAAAVHVACTSYTNFAQYCGACIVTVTLTMQLTQHIQMCDEAF